MAKYRAREIVEAVRWFPGLKIPGLTQVDADTAVIDNRQPASSLVRSVILTEDFITVHAGSYVITYSDGQRSSLRADIFEQRYENIGG